MTTSTRQFRAQMVRFEIFSEAGSWRWRFFDGLDSLPVASRPQSLEQCFKSLQILRNTVAAPIFVVR